MNIRPYVALDLETTGLDTSKSQILQIAAILDNGKDVVQQLPKFVVFVKNDLITYGEPFALGMNAWIFNEIHRSLTKQETKYPVASLEQALVSLRHFLIDAARGAKAWDEANGKDKPKEQVQIAGKNVAGFDIPLLLNQADQIRFDPIASLGEEIKAYIEHRTIDVGAMFYGEFGRNAGLNTINKLTGRTEVSHDALDDCLDVVHAIRYKMGLPRYEVE